MAIFHLAVPEALDLKAPRAQQSHEIVSRKIAMTVWARIKIGQMFIRIADKKDSSRTKHPHTSLTNDSQSRR